MNLTRTLAVVLLACAGWAAHAEENATSSMEKYASNTYTCADYLADLPILAQNQQAGNQATSEQLKRSFIVRTQFSNYAFARLLGVPNAEAVRIDQNQSAVLANELTALCKANRSLNFSDITTKAASRQEAHDKIMERLKKIRRIKPDINSTLLGVLDAQESQKLNNQQQGVAQ